MIEHDTPAHSKAQSIPTLTTFFWRRGEWRMQADSDVNVRRVSPVLAAALESLKIAGVLQEAAPGMFRVSTPMLLPVLNDAESPLQRLARLKAADASPLLDAEQVQAGERLRKDYEKAHLSARVTASYEPHGSSGGRQAQFSDNHIEKLTDSALAARENVHRALQAVGPELSGMLLSICCMSSGLEQAELKLELPKRAGKAVLQLALTRLARHYGFKKSLRHAGPQHIGHWAVQDFRPQIAKQRERQP